MMNDERETINDNNSSFNIFPNPATTELNIVSPVWTGRDLFIKIYDIFGRELINSVLTIQHSTFNIQHFAHGTYFVNIISETTNETRKLIKN